MRRLVIAVALLWAAPVAAQPADVPALIKLVETQPADMDKSTWKEKRRDAARKLSQSKDKRAVPALVKLAETETFDIVGEIAIEGLGNIGDPAAAPVLQKIAADPKRDKAQRDLARKALGKLPEPGTTPTPTPTPKPPDPTPKPPDPTPTPKPPDPTPDPTPPTGTGTSTTGAATGSALLGDKESTTELPALPELPDDTIAAYDRLTFAAGTATIGYDTVRKRAAIDADLGGHFAKRVERERMAWGFDVGANVVAGYINPDGRALVRGAQIDILGTGEARFYTGQLYGVGKAAIGTQVNYVAAIDEDPAADIRDTRTTADLQVAIGGGYGRVIDVGGAIRVRRLGRTLDAARALGKPIDDAIARRLQLTWWALRGERSSYRALVATVAILREAGILLGEPDAGLTYEILNVLRDSQLFLRPSGIDIQLAVGEGYLIRPDMSAAGQEGRVEQVLAQAGYGAQLADDTLELSGAAYARLRLFAPDTAPDIQPSPWAVGASARMRRFTYGDHGDPFGALDLGGSVGASDDDQMDGELALRIEGSLGFTYWLNQASGIRLAGTVAADGGELFIGASLEATYGLLDATFSAR
ncbi:MAG TPA: HEAT repeat domain-containing protein [Kofleriaceae bacterium]